MKQSRNNMACWSDRKTAHGAQGADGAQGAGGKVEKNEVRDVGRGQIM